MPNMAMFRTGCSIPLYSLLLLLLGLFVGMVQVGIDVVDFTLFKILP